MASGKKKVERLISDHHNHSFGSLIALQKFRAVAKNAGLNPAPAAIGFNGRSGSFLRDPGLTPDR
ncbi:hypothetical protein [Adhaeribacter soli]|uniref:Uncharacterized protein n=1 Tax=Adhaeribacter soli TaxID=2607655 RepID=A0A5N1IXK8_9BACT|nr:hypothetical protein [Adhaeribacter soli]KAA9338991.1 hypothetical protein F0P94_09375 [Adhaeribacter soli]